MFKSISTSKQVVANHSASNSDLKNAKDVKEKTCSANHGFVKLCSENSSRRRNEHNVLPNSTKFKGEKILILF